LYYIRIQFMNKMPQGLSAYKTNRLMGKLLSYDPMYEYELQFMSCPFYNRECAWCDILSTST